MRSIKLLTTGEAELGAAEAEGNVGGGVGQQLHIQIKLSFKWSKNYHVQYEHTDLLRKIKLILIILEDIHTKIKVAMLNLYQIKTFHSLKAADSSSGSSSSSPPSPSLKYQHDDVCVPLVPWS